MPASRSALKIMDVFGTGVYVTIQTASGRLIVGTIIGIIGSDRHHDVKLVNAVVEPEFLLVKLTVPSDPYLIGQTIAINVVLIATIG